MTTRRRVARDRRRYNALRKLALRIVRLSERFEFERSIMLQMRARWPHYRELQADALVFGFRRCTCGKPRQTIRLS